AGINILCEVVGALQVVGPDISGQTVAGVVGQLECFFVSIEGRNCNNRAEDLFLEDAGVRGDVSKYCWLQEVSFREFFRALATGNQAGFFFADLDIGPNFVKMFWVNQSTDFGLWIGWETNFDVGSLSCVALDEFIVNNALDQDTGAGGAAFTVEGEHTEDRGVDGVVQVSIFEDDGWRFAAQLHGQALEVWGGVSHDDLTGTG